MSMRIRPLWIALLIALCAVLWTNAQAGAADLRQIGLITDRPTPAPVGVWTVGPRQFEVSATTRLEGRPDQLAVGYCVEVTYREAAGVNQASKIKAKERKDCETVLTVRGRIASMPDVGLIGDWEIDATAVRADANTEFKQGNGPFAPGVCVELRYGELSRMAVKIETRRDGDCAPREQRVKGLIAARPSDGRLGDWTIGSITATADATTQFEGQPAALVIDACAELRYLPTADGNLARKISAKPRGECENIETRRAAIDAFPADLIGPWVIGGELYTADAFTDFKQDRGAFAPGVCVEVKYGAVTRIAVKIESRNPNDCLPAPQRVTGLINMRPADGLLGLWTIGEIAAQVTPQTQVRDANRLLFQYCAEMKFQPDAAGNTALELKARSRDACEALLRARAVLQTVGGVPGSWAIGDTTYAVDANTELRGGSGTLTPGACVEITYGAETLIATRIESRPAADCMGPERKLTGLIDDRPRDGAIGLWQIAGRPFEVVANTSITGNPAFLQPLYCVEVKYRESAGVNLVRELKAKNRQECEELEDLRGLLETFPPERIGEWVIDGEALTADANTQFKTDRGPFAPGACVRAQYGKLTRLAVKLETQDAGRCAAPDLSARGLIVDRPTDVITGTWIIGDAAYDVTAETQLTGRDGRLGVGYCVEVRYAADSVVATRIAARDREECETVERLIGRLVDLPADLLGGWVIGGPDGDVAVLADANTEFKQQHGPFAVDACVEVRYGATSLIATRIATRDACDPPAGNPRYERAYGVLEAFPPDLLGIWTIGEGEYTADAATRVRTPQGPLAAGVCARVDYLPETNRALRIESAEAHHCGLGDGGHRRDDARAYGLLVARPDGPIGTWVVGEMSYAAGIGTRIEERAAPLAPGDCLEVRYLRSSNVALRIKPARAEHCGNGSTVGSYADLVGRVDAMPDGRLGEWIVDGRAFTADATTTFRERRGALEVGACVRLRYQTANDLALKIESRHPYECADSTSLPPDEPPIVEVNQSIGGPRSVFIFTADNLPPDGELQIRLNGMPWGSAPIDGGGSATFAIAADPPRAQTNGAAAPQSASEVYSVVVSVQGEALEPQLIVVDPAGAALPAPDNYSGPVFGTTISPTAVGLVGQTAVGGAVWPALLAALALLATTGIARRRNR